MHLKCSLRHTSDHKYRFEAKSRPSVWTAARITRKRTFVTTLLHRSLSIAYGMIRDSSRYPEHGADCIYRLHPERAKNKLLEWLGFVVQLCPQKLPPNS